MKKQFIKEFAIIALIAADFFLAAHAFSQNVSVVGLVHKPPPDIAKPVYLGLDGEIYGCPDGSDLYVRQLEPKKKNAKDPAPQGDFKSFHFITAQVGVLRSTPDQPFLPVCISVK